MKIVSSVLILRALLFCANRNNYDPKILVQRIALVTNDLVFGKTWSTV